MSVRSLVLAAVVLLGACKAVGPDYRKPEVAVPAEFKEAAAGWKRAEPRDEVDRGRWWEMFRDEDLSRLIERIDVSNQSLRAAEARLRQAQAIAAASRASLFPTLDADASATRSRSPGGARATTRSIALDAGWDADLWGRLRRGLESDQALVQASAGDLAAARLSLQAQLATSYFLLRVLDRQKKLLEDAVEAYQRSLTLTENRYRAGVGARADVIQADTQLKSTQAQAVEIGVRRSQFEHAIALLVGVPPAELSIPPQPPYSPELPVVPAGLPSALLERRPDVAAAERRVAAANANIGVAQAAFFPSLTLSASLGYRATAGASLLSAPSLFWSLGPALAMTLFDAGRRKAQTEQAIATYEETVADYRQTALQSFTEVEDNLAAVRILEEQAKLQAEAVESARLAVTLTTNQYKAGTTSYLSVVQVQTTHLANERVQVGIIGERLAATVALVRAIGGGWRASDLPPAK
jgi:NodT family efflux transporter outer membrane factor (OMF) lipoprotein